jgi:hypothetical protein
MPEKPLLKFKVPNVKEIEGYAVQLADGSIVVRTKEELEQMPKVEKKEETK